MGVFTGAVGASDGDAIAIGGYNDRDRMVRKVSIGEAEALASVLNMRLDQLLSGPSRVSLELAERHLKELANEVKLAVTRFQSGQSALAQLADHIGKADLGAYDSEQIAWTLNLTPADIIRELELDNIEYNAGSQVRADIEAAEDRHPNESRFESGYLEGFLADRGNTINRTIAAEGYSAAWAAFRASGETSRAGDLSVAGTSAGTVHPKTFHDRSTESDQAFDRAVRALFETEAIPDFFQVQGSGD